MAKPSPNDPALIALMQAISLGDTAQAAQRLAEAPGLAGLRLTMDAQFEWPKAAYIGDTPLHIAAAVYDVATVDRLIGLGADIHTRNRRGATPLHYASVGSPGFHIWNPDAQVMTLKRLVAAGADPNAVDKGGVAPLHRAVRTRTAAAVEALLALGADINARNDSGSTALTLARHTTGRSGSGSPEARAQRAEIIRILEAKAEA